MELGSLGKSKTISKLIEDGYDVFTEFEGKSPFDLVGHKNGKLFRVEVKTTKTRTSYDTGWAVQIKRVRPNKTKTVIHNFSQDQCDLLAIYIYPIDKVLIYKSSDVKTRCQLTILDKELEGQPDKRAGSVLKTERT